MTNRWNVATPGGKRWNECRAASPCLADGCPRPRYVSPAGWANLRCAQHEAEAHRARWLAHHPGARPHPRRGVGYGALVAAIDAAPDP